jgi:hypothetical protein
MMGSQAFITSPEKSNKWMQVQLNALKFEFRLRILQAIDMFNWHSRKTDSRIPHAIKA